MLLVFLARAKPFYIEHLTNEDLDGSLDERTHDFGKDQTGSLDSSRDRKSFPSSYLAVRNLVRNLARIVKLAA